MSKNYKPLSVKDAGEKLIGFAKENKKIMIISHVNPDGDTVGSAFALKCIYEKLTGKKNCAKCVCHADAAPYLKHFYSGQDSIRYTPGEENGFDAIIAVDVASPAQLGYLQSFSDKIDFMIDHHAQGVCFADYLTEPSACAAGEIVFDIYKYIKENTDNFGDCPEICRLLYVALSADTGSFRYTNTTPKSMTVAAELMKTVNFANDGGECTAEIARLLHDNCTLGELKAKKIAIDNLKFACNGKIAYVIFTADVMEKNGISELDIGGMVDLPRSIEGVEIGITAKQNKNNTTQFRISSRSNKDADVSAVCALFGGGGHVKAAGANLSAETPEEAEKIIISAFSKALADR